jgi:hypothetical protein
MFRPVVTAAAVAARDPEEELRSSPSRMLNERCASRSGDDPAAGVPAEPLLSLRSRRDEGGTGEGEGDGDEGIGKAGKGSGKKAGGAIRELGVREPELS